VSETIGVEKQIKCVTHNNSRCSSNETITMSIRIPTWLLQKIKEKGTSNISHFVRKLLLKEVECPSTTEEELEYELQRLKKEMEDLQDYHKTLLKHGSYAKDYLEKLKDGITVTHNPFNYSKALSPTLSQEEIGLVDETVKIREELAKQYCGKLKELLKLKREKYKLESKTVDSSADAKTKNREHSEATENQAIQTVHDCTIVIEG